MTAARTDVIGRLVLDDRVVPGRVAVKDGVIVAVDVDGEEGRDAVPGRGDGPFITPGFVDVHTHGGGGHDVMDGAAGMDGTARHLIRHGVTSFLPTGVTAPIPDLVAYAAAFRTWRAAAGPDVSEPLGFNLEGPFLSAWRKGAHDPTFLRDPADVPFDDLEPLIEGLRLMTVAPELPGALELIGWLRERGVATAMGHSASTLDQALAGYAAGGTSTTHLFNAMTGVDHRSPGLAVAALGDDAAYVELIADGIHVHPALWPLITRTKPTDRLLLISDAISLAGTDTTHATIGGLDVEVVGQRVTLVGTTTLAGSVIALDLAVRNVVASGVSLPDAVAAASRNPLGLLGVTDRGRLTVGQRADLVELDDDLAVRRVMRAGTWVA